jgi:hypothetical protein
MKLEHLEPTAGSLSAWVCNLRLLMHPAIPEQPIAQVE